MEDAMFKLHSRKVNVPEPKIIDYHEKGDIFEFTVRYCDSPITDTKFRGSKKEWEAFFEAQRLIQVID